MTSKINKIWQVTKRVLTVIGSGFLGVVVTLIYQHNTPQSFTFVMNGNEVVVTESSYATLLEDNEHLKSDLEIAKGQIGDKTIQLQDLQKQLDEYESEERIHQIISEATSYWTNSNYIQSLTILRDNRARSEEILTLYQKYSEDYSLTLIAQADNLVANRKYDEAKEILSNAKNIVANASVLNDRISEINNNMPRNLSNLKISSSRFFELRQDRAVEDSVGNKYSPGNNFIIHAEGDSGYGYATFYLGSTYTGLTGTIAVSDESEDPDGSNLEGHIEIYTKNGEDYTHLYSSPDLNRTVSPIEIPELTLSNAESLEIRYYNNGTYFSLAGGYHSLRIIITNVVVYSD